MGKCIICGTSTDGPVCDTHQEDVVFEFRGDRAGQLTEGRFYRGVVDGYADFGVFIDLSPRVTGLLHRSKIDKRLESLDWEPGDSVYVQVTNVRDNGDVDLGWSIRQTDREFRGTLIDEPEGDRLPDEEEEEDAGDDARSAESADASRVADDMEADVADEPETASGGSQASVQVEQEPEREVEAETETPADDAGAEVEAETEAETESETAVEAETDAESGADDATDLGYARLPVGDLRDHVGENVRLEGEVVSVRQTSGPTVFELGDESGVVDCAAFVEAGVRAYPEVETGDVVRLDGEVRVRRDELQVETEALVALEGDERETVETRMADALDAEASPDAFEPLAEDGVVADIVDDVEAVATTIRRAVLESRPVVVRHDATTDGYVAGAAIERAVLPLVREEHANTDAPYHYFDRRPLEAGSYDMNDATKDTTRMLDNRERHDEKLPLFVFAAAGSTADSLDGLELLDLYGVETVVVDGIEAADAVRDLAAGTATVAGTTAGVVAANVAAAVNDDVRDDLGHLPAVTFWEDTPEAYAALAEEAGIDAAAAGRLREAVALEAFYQSYEDKRELIIDLLFDQEVGLAEAVSEQFREKLDAELAVAEANIETRDVDGTAVSVLDTQAYTHRFDFPPKALLLDELHRRGRDDTPVVVGHATDELFVRATGDVDLDAVAEDAAERAPTAGISAQGLRTGKLAFLSGRREEAVDAVLAATVDRL
ncbi:OB-fold nucleic acid binding domain-containing protein [Halosegnis marinus]|uniref:OB-fold nucleic acid binding domain-containing protein n=1 Tax=Halosegnis marinus TaxID=3034023 RepID=A0ABD5ZSB8_9EURY|nr:OB-fold nucleic acid binding domain-containing protein [Halosegnis sp. DT85]